MRWNCDNWVTLLIQNIVIASHLVLPGMEASARPPAAAMLQAGDFIWPKKPDAIIPYDSRPGKADKSDELRWKKERADYLKKLRGKGNLSKEEKERYAAIQKMTYEEFAGLYFGNSNSGEPSVSALGNLTVGRVGIIEIINARPFVLEAVVGLGVRRQSYANWLRDRPDELIWLGRLKGFPLRQRAAVAEKAAEQIGRPYNFWNFDLADTNGFYCSKLVWLAVMKGADFPPDDNPHSKRVIWYSPKQLMQSRHIELVVKPRDYVPHK